jgi:hypothetical protein
LFQAAPEPRLRVDVDSLIATHQVRHISPTVAITDDREAGVLVA